MLPSNLKCIRNKGTICSVTYFPLVVVCNLVASVFHLVNDINSIFQLLSLQKWMQVVQQELEVMLSVSVGDDDGGAMPGLTVRWPVTSPTHHQWIFPLNCFESEPWWKVYMDRPTCEHKVVCCHYRQETRLEPRQIIWLEHDSLWVEGDIVLTVHT